jgi:two-component system CheB/CheR fusion protein
MAADEPSENEERLRFVANAVPALLGYVDTGACYVWCNESYRRWFAYSPEELRGRHLRDVLGVSAWELLRPYAERALAGEEVTFESRVAYKRGPARDVRATYIPNKDSSGKVRGFVVLANDISEIRAAEQALRKSERMLERSQSTAHVGSFDVTLVDTDGERAGSVRWSDETFRMFGCEPGAFEVTHASFFEFIHPDDRERVRAGSPGKIQRALPFENDFRFVRADGVVRDMHTWTVFYTDATGRPIRMIGTCQDITERKRAEQELVEADRRKDEFLAMLSHELRNPLAPILNAIEIIERAGPGEEELRSTFQAVIARQVQHMKRLLDDLLDVSRVSRGKIELRKQPVELATLLRQAVEVSRPLLTEKRQQLAQKLGHEPMPLEADPTRVIQVFANILNNAAKFTPAGGHITLSSAVDAGNAVVKIRDDGAGMSDALLARAFELFAQETRAFDRAQGGLGIGLTLVKTLVKMHGGSVHAFSEGPGRGTELMVRLPLAAAVTTPVARAAARRAEAAAVLPLRVLVVDDNVDAADAMRHVLRMDGHQVRVAYDGPGALAATAAEAPDLVLLDIGLPGMDGYAVAAQMREAGLNGAALVAVTGYGQEEDLHRSAAAGFTRHLVKPVDAALLRRVVAEVSDRLQARRARS